MSRRSIAQRLSIALVALCLMRAASAQSNQIPTEPTTPPGSRPPARTLTLEEAVQVALRNSKALRSAAEEVRRARGVVNENRAGFLPSLGADATFTRLDEGSTAVIPAGPGQPPLTVPIVRQDQKSVGIAAELPIDITGQIRAAVDAAEFQEIATRLHYNSVRNQVVLDVKNAYYDVLRAKALVRVAEQALKNAQDREATAQAYLRAGTGTRFDVLRAQTEVADAQQKLIAARNGVNLAIASLNNVLNIDQNTPLETVETSQTPIPSVDLDQSLAEAYEKRPEALQADAQIRAAQKGILLARRSSEPTLRLSWNFSYTPDAGGFAPKTTTWAAIATVRIPLFDQGLSRARNQQAQADLNVARIAKQQVLDGIALEVRQAYLALVEAQERLKVTTAGLVQAEEQYRLAQVRYKAGVTLTPGASPLLEISDAQTALTQAQTNQVNAQYDVQNARARLERALGLYAYDNTTYPGLPAPNTGGKK